MPSKLPPFRFFNRGTNLPQQSALNALRFGQTMRVLSPRITTWLVQGRQPSADEVRETFEKLGTTYIKLGQFIASSPSLFPREYVEAFQDCLDQVEPIPYRQIHRVLKKELSRPVDEIFRYINPEPLASASIAQVHAATLINGEQVVIKVQKPGVENIISTDMNTMFMMSRLIELTSPGISKASITDMVSALYQSMSDECDFIKEAQHMENFAQFLRQQGIEDVTVPKVHAQASTRRLLTMEHFNGVSISDFDQLKLYSDNPAEVLIRGLNTWLKSLTQCQEFHADLHGGNLMLLEDGRLGFIDFGMVGRIAPEAWQAMLNLIQAIEMQDYTTMARSMIKVGMTDREVNETRLAQDLKKLIEQPAAHPNDIDNGINQLMIEMTELGKKHGIRFPASFTLLLKQFFYFDRYIQQLLPDMNDIFNDHRMSFH